MAVLFALLASLGFGSAAVSIRLGLLHMRSTTGTFVSLAASLLVIMGLAWAFNFRDIFSLPAIAFGWFALLGLVNYLLGRLLNFSAVSLAGASRATPIVAVSPLFAALFAVLFRGERLTPIILLGTLALVLGLVLILSEGLRDAGSGQGQ